MTVITIRKRRFKRPRRMMPTGRRPLRARSLYPRRMIIVTKGRISLYKKRRPLRRIFQRFHAPMDLWRRFGQFQREMKRIENIWKKPQEKTWKKTKQRTWSSRRRRTYRRPSFRRPTIRWNIKPTRKVGFKKKPDHIKKESEIDTGFIRLPRFGKKGFVYDRRGGARDMSGRKYENYGPYPKHLGPDLVFDIIPTRELIIAIEAATKAGKNIGHFKTIIKEGIDKVREDLLVYAKRMISIHVPIETGDLQKSMMYSLEKSKRMNYRLKVEISAEVDWAGVANEMPEKRIQHFGNKIGRRSRKLLYDPKAHKGSYYFILSLLKDKSEVLIKDMINNLIISLATSTGRKYIRPNIKKVQRYEKIPSQPSGYSVRVKEIVHHTDVGYTSYFNRDIPRLYAGGRVGVITGVTEEEREIKKRTLRQRMKTPIQFDYPKDLIKEWFKIKGLYKYR